jgi:hypothetical protein
MVRQKVTLSLYLLKHYIMKMCVVVSPFILNLDTRLR